MTQITPLNLQQWLVDKARIPPILLDVREPWEYQTCHIDGATLVPMRTIPARLQDFDPASDIIVICHHGARSYQVGMFLEQNGFTKMYNLQGGVNAWADQVDPSMPRY